MPDSGLPRNALDHAGTRQKGLLLVRSTIPRLVDLVCQQNGVRYAVAMGLGISIVICLTDADRTRLAARSLAKYFPSRSYGVVVVRKGKYLSQQARDFIELIQPQMLAMREYDGTGHSER